VFCAKQQQQKKKNPKHIKQQGG